MNKRRSITQQTTPAKTHLPVILPQATKACTIFHAINSPVEARICY
jgi:hypothetical protein